jgi:hypothetical protein
MHTAISLCAAMIKGLGPICTLSSFSAWPYVIIFAEFNYYISPRAVPRDAAESKGKYACNKIHTRAARITQQQQLKSSVQLAMIETYFAFVWRAGSRGTPHIYDSSFAIYVC